MASGFSVLCLLFLTILSLRDLPMVNGGLTWSRTFSYRIPFSIDAGDTSNSNLGSVFSSLFGALTSDTATTSPGGSSENTDAATEESGSNGSSDKKTDSSASDQKTDDSTSDSGSGDSSTSNNRGETGSKRNIAPAPADKDTSSTSGNEIVDIHNKYRRTAGAANMKMLKWSESAAGQAQAWANTCPTTLSPHSDEASRVIPGFESCGQNVAWRQGSAFSWPDALEQWWAEKEHFRYCKPPTGRVRHYTQLMWADTAVVGCAVRTDCNTLGPNTIVYVCNYCNAGNIITDEPNSQYCPW
ncbi:uncharacterized protein LOC129595924 [Paramacrobiotus metropolitanus]|uniref:uncharacterized protein LOC129595924 n=1 Tax=Paramacrobiotus metropolitanus TaxID=2943436 RepID=UPI0024463061|nr:uncharacterized protein LOC129595924 [Paramacrobiotus metropolitanus]